MKPVFRIAAIGLALAMIVAMVASGQVRKLPESAYIKTAKIELSYDDLQRCPTALAMMDSLLMYYGPHADGYYLVARIWEMYIEKTSGLAQKAPYVAKYALYLDSLKWVCSNKDIKAKYRGNCDLNIKILDSIKVNKWRTFFNSSIGYTSRMDTIAREMASQQDTAVVRAYKDTLNIMGDSADVYAQMAASLDPSNHQSYLVLGTVYEKRKDYAKSTEWLSKGLARALSTQDSSQILMQMAYNEVYAGRHASAIPYFHQYLALVPNDTSNLYNLSICFINQKMYDSAAATYRQILAVAPANSDALVGMGHYFNQYAQAANDSFKVYSEKNDTKTAAKWTDARTACFDSSHTYLQRASVAAPSDAGILEEYAVVTALLNRYDEAATAFAKLGELEPNSSSAWTSLGDCYLNLKKFPEAAAAYEKVVTLEPTNREILERLSDLYGGVLNRPDRKAEIDKKMK